MVLYMFLSNKNSMLCHLVHSIALILLVVALYNIYIYIGCASPRSQAMPSTPLLPSQSQGANRSTTARSSSTEHGMTLYMC